MLSVAPLSSWSQRLMEDLDGSRSSIHPWASPGVGQSAQTAQDIRVCVGRRTRAETATGRTALDCRYGWTFSDEPHGWDRCRTSWEVCLRVPANEGRKNAQPLEVLGLVGIVLLVRGFKSSCLTLKGQWLAYHSICYSPLGVVESGPFLPLIRSAGVANGSLSAC